MSAPPIETPTLTTLQNGNFLLNGQEITLDALCALGLDRHRGGDVYQAAAIYQEILKTYRRHLGALHGLGLIAFQSNDLSGALDFLNQALDVAPDNAVLYYDRALVFQRQGENFAAIKNYDLAVFLNNTYVSAYSNRGIALEAVGKPDLALANYEIALSLDPSFASAWYNRANLYKANNLFSKAIQLYSTACALNPSFWESFTNMGLCWYALKENSAALKAYDQAALLHPTSAVIHYNRANVFRTLGDFSKALEGYDTAVQFNPRFASAFANRGLVKKDLNLLDEATQDYKRALELDPQLLEAQWNLSIVEMMRGNWDRGWEGYELRFQHADLRDSVGARDFKEPRWNGTTPLIGKRILIYCEQGLGDAIQFSRYLPLLGKLGAIVILEVQQALKDLFTGLEGVDALIVRGESLPLFDYYCPLLSLPRAFKTTPGTIPPLTTLNLNPTQTVRWEKIVANQISNALGVKKIGLVWRGNPRHTNDHNRSLSLQELLEHLPREHFYFILQKEVSAEDRRLLGNYSTIFNPCSDLLDLTDTGSLCLQLDLVICVDTSVAHLSASLNIPTWILLPYCPDWRWLMHREDSPWYPSVRLLRQTQPGDWQTPLLKLKAGLVA